jgi:hypothetical protein
MQCPQKFYFLKLITYHFKCLPSGIIMDVNIDLPYIQNISEKRIRYGINTSVYDRNYLPVPYSNFIISKTH